MNVYMLKQAGRLATLSLLMIAPSAVSAITLQDAVQQTLKSNPELQASLNGRKASEQSVKQSRAGYFPEIYVAAGVGDESTDSPYTRSLPGNPNSVDLTRREIAFVVRQQIYDGLATPQTVASNEARLLASDMRHKSLQEQLTLRTTDVYLAVLRERKLLELARENLDAHRKIMQRVEQRAERGVGRRADLSQVQGRVALAESQVIASEANLNNALVNYLRVVGNPAPDVMQAPESLASALPINVEAAAELAVKNNPSMQTAQAEVQAANANRKVARSGLHPQLDLVFEQTWDENLDGVEGENEGYSLMLQLKYNLFNGGGDMARSRQAAFRVNESLALQDNARRAVIENLNLAWTRYKAVRSQLIFLKQHVDSSIESQTAYDKQFNLGRRTLLDLLDARNELFQANRAYFSAQFDSLYQQYRVLAAMGELSSQFNNTGSAE